MIQVCFLATFAASRIFNEISNSWVFPLGFEFILDFFKDFARVLASNYLINPCYYYLIT